MILACRKTNRTARIPTCALGNTIGTERRRRHHLEQGQQDRYDEQDRHRRHACYARQSRQCATSQQASGEREEENPRSQALLGNEALKLRFE
jgi:hypothetical protein